MNPERGVFLGSSCVITVDIKSTPVMASGTVGLMERYVLFNFATFSVESHV